MPELTKEQIRAEERDVHMLHNIQGSAGLYRLTSTVQTHFPNSPIVQALLEALLEQRGASLDVTTSLSSPAHGNGSKIA